LFASYGVARATLGRQVLSDLIGSRLNGGVPGDRSSVARARAAELFAFAARQESDLSRAGQLRCWEAVEMLALTSTDVEARNVGAGPGVSPSRTPGSAHAAIREGLAVLGRLDLGLFADSRVRAAAKHARRALRSTPE
jgi:hypothetical protein